MSVGRGYKKEKNNLEESYDAIVIGTGIGGLTTAALLAKAQRKVLMLEKHYTAGGYTHTFTRKNYEWDVGVHYIGEVHRKNSLLRRTFDYISENRLQWAKMCDVYDRAIFGEDKYDFVSGVEAFREKMGMYFPQEKQAIDQYIDRVFAVNSASRLFFGERALAPWMGKLSGPFLKRRYLKHSDLTLKQALSDITSNEALIGVLSTQWGDHGLPPGEASFAIHAMIARHYFDGGNYPVGGSASIAESIAPTIENEGGKILIRADVQEILVQDGQAIGVRMEDGNEIKADLVVSNAGANLTYNHLLSETHSEIQSIRQKLQTNTRPSSGHFCLYIGLQHTDAELGLEQTNLWCFPSYDHDANVQKYVQDPTQEFPLVYISFPSSKDPDWENRYPGRSTIEVVSLAPYEWFEKWEGTQWYKRGNDYDEYKENWSQRLLNALYQQVPQVKGKIDHYELSTPLTTKHFCSYEKGELYGLDHTPRRFRQKWLRPHTPIRNLYLTGQDVVTDGVTGAMFGGVISASAILQRNLIGDIAKATHNT